MKKYLLLVLLFLPSIIYCQAFIAPSDTTVCYGNNSGALRLYDATLPVKRWEMSYTGQTPWISIGVLTNKLQFQDQISTAWYRAILQNGSGEVAVGPVRIEVNARAYSGTISGSNLVCSGSNSGVLSVLGYTGSVTKWQFSYEKLIWQDVLVNNPADQMAYSNVDRLTYYRAVVESGKGCTPVISPEFGMQVSEKSNSGTITESVINCEGANAGTIEISGYTGSVIRWETSSTGNAPWSNISNTTNNLTYKNLTQTNFYRAVVQNGVCSASESESSKIQIDAAGNGGIAGTDAAVCSKNNNGYIYLTAYTGSISKWQYSVNLGSTWKDTAIINPQISYNSLTNTRLYRAEVINGVCPSKYSNPVKITVYPLPLVSFTGLNKPQGEAVLFSNNTAITSGNISKYYWDFNDGGFSIATEPQYVFSNFGTYRVKLEAISDKGCVDSAFNVIEIFNVPKVDFVYSNICLKDKAVFLNTTISSDINLTYVWDFGDGSPVSVEKDPVHRYTAAGQYNCTLTVSSSNASSSKMKTIQIYSQASPNFLADNVCVGNMTSFQNQSVVDNGFLSYQWFFGDGSVSTGLNPQYTYAKAGDYVVRLITLTDHSCLDTIYKTISVHSQPIAKFTALDVPFGYPVIFINSSIFVGHLAYQWNFGDDVITDDINPEHNYISSGNFQVSLKVESDSGCSDLYQKTIWVYPSPHADFNFKSVCINDSISFENISSLSFGTLSYKWSFGNEGSSSLKSPKWKFAIAGFYQVQLIAISDRNGTDTIVKTIEIYPQPVAKFTANSVCYGTLMQFTDNTTLSEGSVMEYRWDFGDGSNAIRQSPGKLYLNIGDYPVTLTTTSDHSCAASVTKTVTILENPTANFTAANLCFGMSLVPLNISKAAINSNYVWDMGDSTTYDVFTPHHDYLFPGVWSIKLKVSTEQGCVDSLIRNIVVYTLPHVDAGTDTTVVLGFPVQLNASGGSVFNWYPSDGLSDANIYNPKASPVTNTKYFLTVSDEYGCINRDSITISVRNDYKLLITNIITPDGNGENDTWQIHNIENYPEAKVVVFDRWGKIVLNTKKYQNNWQGRNGNNDILPDGTYYYVIVIPGFNEPYKGTINILRNN